MKVRALTRPLEDKSKDFSGMWVANDKDAFCPAAIVTPTENGNYIILFINELGQFSTTTPRNPIYTSTELMNTLKYYHQARKGEGLILE